MLKKNLLFLAIISLFLINNASASVNLIPDGSFNQGTGVWTLLCTGDADVCGIVASESYDANGSLDVTDSAGSTEDTADLYQTFDFHEGDALCFHQTGGSCQTRVLMYLDQTQVYTSDGRIYRHFADCYVDTSFTERNIDINVYSDGDGSNNVSWNLDYIYTYNTPIILGLELQGEGAIYNGETITIDSNTSGTDQKLFCSYDANTSTDTFALVPNGSFENAFAGWKNTDVVGETTAIFPDAKWASEGSYSLSILMEGDGSPTIYPMDYTQYPADTNICFDLNQDEGDGNTIYTYKIYDNNSGAAVATLNLDSNVAHTETLCGVLTDEGFYIELSRNNTADDMNVYIDNVRAKTTKHITSAQNICDSVSSFTDNPSCSFTWDKATDQNVHCSIYDENGNYSHMRHITVCDSDPTCNDYIMPSLIDYLTVTDIANVTHSLDYNRVAFDAIADTESSTYSIESSYTSVLEVMQMIRNAQSGHEYFIYTSSDGTSFSFNDSLTFGHSGTIHNDGIQKNYVGLSDWNFSFEDILTASELKYYQLRIREPLKYYPNVVYSDDWIVQPTPLFADVNERYMSSHPGTFFLSK